MGLIRNNENIGFRYYDVLSQNTQTTNIAGYDEFVQIWRTIYPNQVYEMVTLNSGEGKIKISENGNTITIQKDENAPLKMDMESLLRELEDTEKINGMVPGEKMSITIENEFMKVMISFTNIAFQVKENIYTVERYNAYLFIENKH